MSLHGRWSRVALGLLVVFGGPRVLTAGQIQFTGDASLVAALGRTVSTGATRLAVGQTLNLPFSATVAGVESVSGTVVLTNTAGGGSVRLDHVVFTVLSSTGQDAEFGLKVTQAFVSSNIPSIDGLETASGSSHLTPPGEAIQPGSVVTTAKYTVVPSIAPDSPNSSYGYVPAGGGGFGFPSSTYPLDQSFQPLSVPLADLPKSTGNPVTLAFTYMTSISTFNATTGAGSSTTLDSATLSFQPSPVPEPSGLALAGLGVIGLGLLRRRPRAT